MCKSSVCECVCVCELAAHFIRPGLHHAQYEGGVNFLGRAATRQKGNKEIRVLLCLNLGSTVESKN